MEIKWIICSQDIGSHVVSSSTAERNICYWLVVLKCEGQLHALVLTCGYGRLESILC
jgi:hypothetical protein